MSLKKLSPKPSAREDDHFFVNIKALKSLSKVLEETGLTEIDYEQKGVRIRLSRSVHVRAETLSAYSPAAPEPVAVLPKAEPPKGRLVPSPMVGTAYLAPQPGAEPFVKVGDHVQEGQILLVIEAMKIINPLKSPFSGKITKIAVDNASPIEYGTELVWIE